MYKKLVSFVDHDSGEWEGYQNFEVCGLWAIFTVHVCVLIYDGAEVRGPCRSFDRRFLPQKAMFS